MDTSILQQFIELLSLANLAQSLLALALAWVLLRGVRAALGYLTERFPRYRLQLGQSFPFIRILVWSAVAGSYRSGSRELAPVAGRDACATCSSINVLRSREGDRPFDTGVLA